MAKHFQPPSPACAALANTAAKFPAYVGHVDAIERGEIYGWALNVRSPSEPVLITVTIDERPVAEALAGYYRPDVAVAMDCSGRNGFYVDLDSLCSPGQRAKVQVRFPDNDVPAGGPLFFQASERRPLPTSKTLLFMHIPKTAGTAFREMVLRNYKQSEVMYIYGDPPGFPSTFLGDIPLRQRQRLRLVFGHYGYGVHNDVPNECEYAALIRSPLHRVWSHYLHLVRDNHLATINREMPKPIEQVLEERLSVHLDNLYVRYFSGLDESKLPPGGIDRHIYALALENVQRRNVLLRLQDDLPGAYDSMAEEFGWIRGLECSCINASPDPKFLPGPSQEAAIRHFNKWDFMLYGEMLRVGSEKIMH